MTEGNDRPRGRVQPATAAAVICACMLALGYVGMLSIKSGQDEIRDIVQRDATRATRTIWVDWICRDGENVHVEATSEVNEPRDIFFSRFDSDVAEREREHPRR